MPARGGGRGGSSVPDRPNFFDLLGYLDDPSRDDWSDIDWPSIQATLEGKRRVWSDRSVKGPDTAGARRNLELLPEIRSVMSDAARRGEEARDAAELRRKERAQNQKELAHRLSLAEGRRVSSDQVNRLIKALARTHSEEDIRKALKIAAPSEEVEREGAPRLDLLDPTTKRDIGRELAFLKKRDLYDFLGLATDAPLSDLQNAANGKHSTLTRIGSTKPVPSAEARLCGQAMAVFKTTKARQQYDNTRAVEPLDDLEKVLEWVADGGVVEAAQFRTILDRAKKEKGVDRDLARRYFEDLARKRRWKIETLTTSQEILWRLQKLFSPLGPRAGLAMGAGVVLLLLVAGVLGSPSTPDPQPVAPAMQPPALPPSPNVDSATNVVDLAIASSRRLRADGDYPEANEALSGVRELALSLLGTDPGAGRRLLVIDSLMAANISACEEEVSLGIRATGCEAGDEAGTRIP